MGYTCKECNVEMVMDGYVKERMEVSGLMMFKKKFGFMNSYTAEVKAAICPRCKEIKLYADENDNNRIEDFLK